MSGCGKDDQTLRYARAHLKIKDRVLKREINTKLKIHQEFIAMNFVIAEKQRYLNILDQRFIREYCQAHQLSPITMYIDGFQVDIQFDQQFQRQIIIKKVDPRS